MTKLEIVERAINRYKLLAEKFDAPQLLEDIPTLESIKKKIETDQEFNKVESHMLGVLIFEQRVAEADRDAKAMVEEELVRRQNELKTDTD